MPQSYQDRRRAEWGRGEPGVGEFGMVAARPRPARSSQGEDHRGASGD